MAQPDTEGPWIEAIMDRYKTLLKQREKLISWNKMFRNSVPLQALNMGAENLNRLNAWISQIKAIELKIRNHAPTKRQRMMHRIKVLTVALRRYRKIRCMYKRMHKNMCDQVRQEHGEEGFAQLQRVIGHLSLPEM